MHEISKDVKLKGKKVDEVTVPQYESMDELLDAEAATVVLKMFNQQKLTKAMNEARAAKSPTRAGKKIKNQLAFNLCSQEELISCQGDFNQLQKLLDSKMPQVEADLDPVVESEEEEAVE